MKEDAKDQTLNGKVPKDIKNIRENRQEGRIAIRKQKRITLIKMTGKKVQF